MRIGINNIHCSQNSEHKCKGEESLQNKARDINCNYIAAGNDTISMHL